MSEMHPSTKGTVLAAIRAEVQADPTERGYAGQTTAEIAALMNAPVVVEPAPAYRDVPVSDVRGYLEARLVLVRLEDWVANPATPGGDARDAARTLLRVTSNSGIQNFTTSTEGGRSNILGMFGLLVQAGAGGLTLAHYAELAAMTLAPAGTPVTTAPRWALLIDGISGEEGHPGPPNAADAALIEEALADG